MFSFWTPTTPPSCLSHSIDVMVKKFISLLYLQGCYIFVAYKLDVKDYTPQTRQFKLDLINALHPTYSFIKIGLLSIFETRPPYLNNVVVNQRFKSYILRLQTFYMPKSCLCLSTNIYVMHTCDCLFLRMLFLH